MSDDGKWKPLSFEDEQYKMYPDQFHIFENYGQSSENILPESLLAQSDFVTNRVRHKNIKVEEQGCVNINRVTNLIKGDSSGEESDDEYTKLKEVEQAEKEQIRSMRNIGLLPNIETCLTSKKTAPIIINQSTKSKKGPPIILDEDFFKFDSTKNESIQENIEKVNDNLSPNTSVYNVSSITSDISRISVGSNNSSFNSSCNQISSSDEQNKSKPRSVHEHLKIKMELPNLKTKKTFEDEFPCLNNNMKKIKKKSNSQSENLFTWEQ